MKRQESAKKLAKIQRRVIKNSGLEKISAIIADMRLCEIRDEGGSRIYSFRSEDSGNF